MSADQVAVASARRKIRHPHTVTVIPHVPPSDCTTSTELGLLLSSAGRRLDVLPHDDATRLTPRRFTLSSIERNLSMMAAHGCFPAHHCVLPCWTCCWTTSWSPFWPRRSTPGILGHPPCPAGGRGGFLRSWTSADGLLLVAHPLKQLQLRQLRTEQPPPSPVGQIDGGPWWGQEWLSYFEAYVARTLGLWSVVLVLVMLGGFSSRVPREGKIRGLERIKLRAPNAPQWWGAVCD